jgi:hypothetical protein
MSYLFSLRRFLHSFAMLVEFFCGIKLVDFCFQLVIRAAFHIPCWA